MPTHPLFWLLAVTLILVMLFAGWSWLSADRHQKTGGKTDGLGGPNDPLG
jgi:hypothetical protein